MIGLDVLTKPIFEANTKTWSYLITKLMRDFGFDKYAKPCVLGLTDWMDKNFVYVLWTLFGLFIIGLLFELYLSLNNKYSATWKSVLKNKSFIATIFFGIIISSLLIYNSQDKSNVYISEKYENSVVLITMYHCYKVTMPTVYGETERKVIYFYYLKDMANMKKLSEDTKKELRNKAIQQILSEIEKPDSVWDAISCGTGFFFDDSGRIMTNRHVLDADFAAKAKNPYYDEKRELNMLKSFIKNCFVGYYSSKVHKLENDISKLKEQIVDSNIDDKLLDSLTDLYQQKKTYEKKLYEFNQMDWSTLLLENEYKYTILYNGSNEKNEVPCKFLSVSGQWDLGMIQGPDTTINNINPITININRKEPVKKGENVYYAGYSYGRINNLSITNNIVNAQFVDGKIIQVSDDRILYNIDVLPGSSGGPVFNSDGELYAVQSEGYENSTYNCGEPLKHIIDFLNSYQKRKRLRDMIKNIK